MKRRTRIYYTPEQKAIIWDRYKQGDSLHDIARMFDRFHSSIMPTIHQTGGYRPPVRKRHRLALSLDEREEISRGLVAKLSIRDIAAKLSRAPSTISREVRRHGGAKQYRAAKADATAWENALRPKPCKLIESPALCKIIAEKMHQDWSPEQIAGWLKRCYPTLIRSIRIELSLEPVGRHDTGLAFTCPRAPVSDLSLYPDTFHQSPDSVHSALLPAVPQIQMDLAITIDASRIALSDSLQ